MYAEILQERFPELDPKVDDLLLLEAHQIAGLVGRAPERELAAVLHSDPRLRRFLSVRHPPIEDFLERLLAEHGPARGDELALCEQALLWEIADWIVYQRAPGRFDVGADSGSDLAIVTEAVDIDGKVVVDAGAGTGRLAFAVSPVVDHVYAVEPVATLRGYMRDKAAQLGIENLFVSDGFLHAIPLPSGCADVVMTRQAIGWNLDEELPEIERVLKPDGIALHLAGMPHPAPQGDGLHTALLDHGYRPGTYSEGNTLKRKYLKGGAVAN